jgi:hypothetical protein
VAIGQPALDPWQTVRYNPKRVFPVTRLRWPLAAIALAGGLALTLVRPAAETSPFFPIDQVRPGMTGRGVSVFEGRTRIEFTARVIGVLENVIGTRRRLVLARLEGGPLAETGVVAGMSGSPVYIDGRLMGAVSYSVGMFSKEPIAGITPIDEMVDATSRGALRPASTRRPLGDLPTTREALTAALRDTFNRIRPFAEDPSELRAMGLPSARATELGLSLRPIATPIVMGGFSRDMQALLTDVFTGAGFAPVTAAPGGTASLPRASEPLQPGDAVGLALVGGDLVLGASGTVTHVNGTRVFAFGHPFMNLGPVAFPMTRDFVHTILPSLMASTKIASPGEIIGSIQQDRATAIAGRLGEPPPMVPVTLTLRGEGVPSRTFRFELVNDQLFTPVLTFATVASTLQSYEREFGAATFTVRGEARVRDHGSVTLEDIFTGDTPSLGAASYVAGPINVLLRNDLAPVEITDVNLSITTSEQPRTARLTRVWVDDATPKAGAKITLHVLTRNYRGEDAVRSIPIDIPAHARGVLSVLVADGASLAGLEPGVTQPQQAQSIDHMIRVFNETRRSNRLYVRLLSQTPGAVVEGHAMPGLPPSVLNVLSGEREGGRVTTLAQAPLGEWEFPTDHAVSGTRTVKLTVEQ